MWRACAQLAARKRIVSMRSTRITAVMGSQGAVGSALWLNTCPSCCRLLTEQQRGEACMPQVCGAACFGCCTPDDFALALTIAEAWEAQL